MPDYCKQYMKRLNSSVSFPIVLNSNTYQLEHVWVL